MKQLQAAAPDAVSPDRNQCSIQGLDALRHDETDFRGTVRRLVRSALQAHPVWREPSTAAQSQQEVYRGPQN